MPTIEEYKTLTEMLYSKDLSLVEFGINIIRNTMPKDPTALGIMRGALHSASATRITTWPQYDNSETRSPARSIDIRIALSLAIQDLYDPAYKGATT